MGYTNICSLSRSLCCSHGRFFAVQVTNTFLLFFKTEGIVSSIICTMISVKSSEFLEQIRPVFELNRPHNGLGYLNAPFYSYFMWEEIWGHLKLVLSQYLVSSQNESILEKGLKWIYGHTCLLFGSSLVSSLWLETKRNFLICNAPPQDIKLSDWKPICGSSKLDISLFSSMVFYH